MTIHHILVLIPMQERRCVCDGEHMHRLNKKKINVDSGADYVEEEESTWAVVTKVDSSGTIMAACSTEVHGLLALVFKAFRAAKLAVTFDHP